MGAIKVLSLESYFEKQYIWRQQNQQGTRARKGYLLESVVNLNIWQHDFKEKLCQKRYKI